MSEANKIQYLIPDHDACRLVVTTDPRVTILSTGAGVILVSMTPETAEDFRRKYPEISLDENIAYKLID